MLLLVGLGNPGTKYAGNRHNVGFMAVDRIAADHGFGPWKPRFQGLAAEGRLGSVRVTLLKPQGFMNLSGQSVGEAMRYLKLDPDAVVVIHDELDLAPGWLRVKSGGGHAGHNGLRSIHQHIGEGYRRVRIGIGHPGHKDRVAGYVLSDFAKAEEGVIDDVIRGVSDGAEALAAGDETRFQNAVASRSAPPRNSGTARPGEAAGSGARPRTGPAAAAAGAGPAGGVDGDVRPRAATGGDAPVPPAPAPGTGNGAGIQQVAPEAAGHGTPAGARDATGADATAAAGDAGTGAAAEPWTAAEAKAPAVGNSGADTAAASVPAARGRRQGTAGDAAPSMSERLRALSDRFR